jgi:ATP-binding cassette subfamily B (MDR/TAP) protein 1
MRAKLVAKFDEYLTEAHRWGNKTSPLFGALFSVEYTIIYLGFGLTFWRGVQMLARGDIETSGQIFTYAPNISLCYLALTN